MYATFPASNEETTLEKIDNDGEEKREQKATFGQSLKLVIVVKDASNSKFMFTFPFKRAP